MVQHMRECARVSGSVLECARIGAGASADRRGSERGNRQENDKNQNVLVSREFTKIFM